MEFEKINMEEAWDIPQPNTITVAVIDTGVDYTHVEFGGCTITSAYKYM